MTKAESQAKRGRGRPKLADGDKRQNIKLTLPQHVIERLEEIGEGNKSLGVERAVESMPKTN